MIRPTSLSDDAPGHIRPGDPASLVELLRGRPIVALSGAGCSTESGIPDYRGPEGRFRTRTPMGYQEFMDDPRSRARYWARSVVGWPRFSAARPNPAHRALARLEAEGRVRGVITQNVDGLHQAAGSRRVLELHGALAAVRCTSCGNRVERDRFQERLLEKNPGWEERVARDPTAGVEGDGAPGDGAEPVPEGEAELAPDGDAEVPAELVGDFRVPGCMICSGVMKPDVVFFGESVPGDRVEEAWRLFSEAESLLVVGSSLSVYSGRRFVLRAAEEGVPVGVVNLGPTRADEVARARVEGEAGEVLPAIADALLGD